MNIDLSWKVPLKFGKININKIQKPNAQAKTVTSKKPWQDIYTNFKNKEPSHRTEGFYNKMQIACKNILQGKILSSLYDNNDIKYFTEI